MLNDLNAFHYTSYTMITIIVTGLACVYTTRTHAHTHDNVQPLYYDDYYYTRCHFVLRRIMITK